MVCPPPTGLRSSLFMQKFLAEDFLVQPHHLRLQSLSGAYINPDTPPHWRQRDELSGINVLTLGIYAEIVQRWFGPITHVFAHQKTINPVRQGYEVRIPDMVVVLCKFENGMEGVMEFSGVALFETSDRLQVFGSQGMLSYDFRSEQTTGGRLRAKDAAEINYLPKLKKRGRV